MIDTDKINLYIDTHQMEAPPVAHPAHVTNLNLSQPGLSGRCLPRKSNTLIPILQLRVS